jgi:phosphohistidine phosphatase
VKTLFLLRHAKSNWDDASLDDFDRPLAERGREAAPRMGKELAARGWLPDAVLGSAAVRAQQTWTLVAAQLTHAPKPALSKALYMAAPARLLQHVRKTPETVNSLLIIGHNPGLEEFATLIAGDGSDVASLARMGEKFPTAALARFEFEGLWEKLRRDTARLTHFLRPKDLGLS